MSLKQSKAVVNVQEQSRHEAKHLEQSKAFMIIGRQLLEMQKASSGVDPHHDLYLLP